MHMAHFIQLWQVVDIKMYGSTDQPTDQPTIFGVPQTTKKSHDSTDNNDKDVTMFKLLKATLKP